MKIKMFDIRYDERQDKDVFGCASQGVVQAAGQVEAAVFLPDIRSVVCCGSKQEVLAAAVNVTGVRAVIVLFGNCGGEEGFLEDLQRIHSVPAVGGSAAFGEDGRKARLIPSSGEVCLLLVTDDRYDVEVSYKNIHDVLLGEHEMTFDDPRVLKRVDGVDARTWLMQTKKAHKYSVTDFEYITFSGKSGINAHLSLDGEVVRSGRDLEPRMMLRCVRPDDVQKSIQEFYEDESAIIFGCAGLKVITDEPVRTNGLGLFLFGEICYAHGGNHFGNLMLSKIKFAEH